MKFNKTGVVGAGVMGAGVAQNLAQKRMNVVLVDISETALEKAKTTIRNKIRFAGMMQRNAEALDPDELLARIHFTTDLAALSEVDFLVENVVEKWEMKSALYPKLEKICPGKTIFAANTSAISITKIGNLTKKPDRVVGIHFMNPVPMKKTVEVIRGFHTSEETLAETDAFLEEMGKEGIVVNDMPGFVSNRVLMLTINEAIFLVQDQVSNPADIDKIFRNCFGHKMGPLETGDLIGLDTILYSLEVLYESYNDPKFRPSPLLKKMVDAGVHGRKTGQGFFKYPEV